MKRLGVMVALLMLVVQGPLHAQERGPLAMRIMLEWTVGGLFAGALVGGGIWLTDPGREGNRLSDNVASGAAWGAVAGAIFALTVVNAAAIPPQVADHPTDPLDPSLRIVSDPVGQEAQREDLLASAPARAGPAPQFVLPVITMHF